MRSSGYFLILIDRVKDYKNSGLDIKYLRDPDGGIHLLKKKAELGALEETEPDVQSTFPKDGFKCEISGIPKVNFGTIWRYMIENVEFKKKLSTAKPLVKGYNFFMSGHVLFLSHLHENGKHFIKSKVLPSMKKQSVYSCHIVLSSFGNVLRGQCGCPAGTDGRCNHVAAIMFALEDYCKERSKNSTESCTSKPCKWSVPSKRTGSVVPLAHMKFAKHDYNKRRKLRCFTTLQTDRDVRAPHQREWPQSKVANMLSLVQEYQNKSGNKVSWIHILTNQSSVDNNKSEETCVNIPSTNSPCDELLSPIKEHPISNVQLRERCDKVKRRLQFSKEEIDEAEKITQNQSQNPQWYKLRKHRITASQCHRVAVLKECTSPTKAIKEVLLMNPSYQSKCMTEGLSNEEKILAEYIKFMGTKGHKGISVKKCGFFISNMHGFLGASPDGLVNDPSVSESCGLVEIKYIKQNESESLEDALVRKRICKVNNGLVLNHKHGYYYQVQQQMYVTQRSWSDFVVKGSRDTGLFCQRVAFCQAFWEVTLNKLEVFFDRWIAPELAYPRIKYGLDKLDARLL